MNGLEQALRESMRAQVSQPPDLPDLAGRVISDVRRSRTRRSGFAAAAGAAGAAATMLLAGAFFVHPMAPGAAPVTPQPAAASKVAGAEYAGGTTRTAMVLDRSVLALPDGRLIGLAAVGGGVRQAYQSPDGWLLLGNGSESDGTGQSLWLAKSDGSLRCLLSGLAGPAAIGSDSRLSWSTGERLRSGRLDRNGMIKVESDSPVPSGVLPEAVVGDTVVLSRKAPGGGIEYDTWRPERGNYAPTWEYSSHVRKVFGAEANDHALIGLIPASDQASQLCLARLDPANTLKVAKTACEVPGFAGFGSAANPPTAGAVSPNGHRLAVQTDDHLTVLNLTTVFTADTEPTRWNAAEPGVWVDSTTMIAPDNDGWLRSFGDENPDGVPVRLPDGSGPAPAATTVPVGRLS